jgi:hypothetical protein
LPTAAVTSSHAVIFWEFAMVMGMRSFSGS